MHAFYSNKYGSHIFTRELWHTLATDISSDLQTCQPLIESIKVQIPQFHTRAMRQAAFEKYDLKIAIYQEVGSTTKIWLGVRLLPHFKNAFFELDKPDLVYDLCEMYADISCFGAR